jgi:hypothetical protein
LSRSLFKELFDPIKHNGVTSMATKSEFLNELYKDNGLVKEEDTYELSFGKRSVNIITRNGIEKIQYHNNITVTFDVESIDPEFVVVKATAKKGDVSVESYGEASPQNTQQKYPVAMAEKRALSRVVLKITGFYKYGVFGEDESDDFKQGK